jgi:hypothetical protein
MERFWSDGFRFLLPVEQVVVVVGHLRQVILLVPMREHQAFGRRERQPGSCLCRQNPQV